MGRLGSLSKSVSAGLGVIDSFTDRHKAPDAQKGCGSSKEVAVVRQVRGRRFDILDLPEGMDDALSLDYPEQRREKWRDRPFVDVGMID